MIRFGRWVSNATGEPVAIIRLEHHITGHELVAAVLLAADCSEEPSLDGETVETINQLSAGAVEYHLRNALRWRGSDALHFAAWDHSTPVQQEAALAKAKQLFPAAFTRPVGGLL